MLAHVNIPTKSERRILPLQGDINTFQKDNPRLLDRVNIDMRVKLYLPKTEESCTSYIKRFILFNNKKHPNEIGIEEI